MENSVNSNKGPIEGSECNRDEEYPRMSSPAFPHPHQENSVCLFAGSDLGLFFLLRFQVRDASGENAKEIREISDLHNKGVTRGQPATRGKDGGREFAGA